MRFTLIGAALMGCGTLAGCQAGTPNENEVNGVQEQANGSAPETAAPVPRMVIRSTSYRCDDGRALYVDVMTDVNAVNVRDTRSDLPTRLWRQGGDGPFSAENRSLSGTGDIVRYSAPDRPDQECRAAPD